MIPQPQFMQETQSSKKCWTCDNTTDYSFGFCLDCWIGIEDNVKAIYVLTVPMTYTLGGKLRQVIVDEINREKYVPKKQETLNLEDLDL